MCRRDSQSTLCVEAEGSPVAPLAPACLLVRLHREPVHPHTLCMYMAIMVSCTGFKWIRTPLGGVIWRELCNGRAESRSVKSMTIMREYSWQCQSRAESAHPRRRVYTHELIIRLSNSERHGLTDKINGRALNEEQSLMPYLSIFTVERLAS